MLQRLTKTTVLFLLVMCISTGAGHNRQVDALKEGEEPSVVKVREGVYRIGSVVLDRNGDEIRLTGTVNMERGMIEYVACARMGKLHESVLVLDVEPYQLQVALLLLGLEPGGDLEYQGDPRTPRGDSLEIWVEWVEDGETRRYRAEDLVYNIREERPMSHTAWVFTGSKLINGTFMADFEGSLIATYHDPFTIIDNPLPTGADDTLYRVNEDRVPGKGTPVTVTLKPLRTPTER